jgi:hypothetical protein
MTALATILFCLCLSKTGQVVPTITYTCPGKNAKAVFEDISKQAGQTLLIGQSLADEPIILRLEKAPLSKTMERIAFALNGEWKEEKEGTRLVAKKLPANATPYNARLRSIIAMQKAARDEFADAKPFDSKAASDYAKELEEHLSRVEALPKNDTAHLIAGYKLADRSLRTTIGLRVFALLDPRQLAEIGQNERIVWSSQPTAKQRQLPRAAIDLANRYFVDSQIWGKELLNRPNLIDKLRGADWTLSDLVPYQLSGHGSSYISSALPAKVNVIAYSSVQLVSYIVFSFLDSKGKVVFQLSSGLNRNGTRPPALIVEPVLKPIEKPIVLGELASEYCRLTNARLQMGSANGVNVLSSGLLNELINPEISDPLSIAAGPALIQFAEAKAEQLVAVLSDSVVLGVQTNNERIVDQYRFMRYFWPKAREHRVEEADGWITVGVDPILAAEEFRYIKRLPRKPLGNFLRQVKRDGYVSMESAASFLALLGPNPNSFSLFTVINTLGLQGISAEMLVDQQSQIALRLISSLSPLQRIAIKNGEAFEFGSLSEQQRSILRYELYVKSSNFIRTEYVASAHIEGESEESVYYSMDSTELFLPDINPAAKLSFVSTENSRIHIHAIDANGPERDYRLELSDCGESLVALESRGMTFTRFWVVYDRTVTIRLQLDSKSYLEFAVREEQRKTPIVDSIDKLPPEFAKRIRDDMAKFRPPTLEL